jgi:hypothetical protein
MTELKFGRRPPKRAPSIRLAASLTGVVPAHPAAADYLAKLKNWQMLGNDSKGDCVAVTWANVRRLVTATLATEKYPTLGQVLTLYATQNPGGSDNGMDVQTCLEYLVHTGGPDGVKALGFASVDYTNTDEVKASIAIFGSVWVGTNVLAINQQQFSQGKPWDYSASSPTVGGHSIVTGGYGTPGAGALGGDERFITWAQETSFTDTFWAHEVEEVWVVIWPEMMTNPAFLAGVNLQQFATDYLAITGRPFPAPVPPTPVPPTPPPSPTPPPTPKPTPPPAPVPPAPTPPAPPVPVGPKFTRNLYYRWYSLLKGADALWVQQRMNALGFGHFTPTGSYGTLTRDAVKRFQTSKGLVVDGIVGKRTWSALGGLF